MENFTSFCWQEGLLVTNVVLIMELYVMARVEWEDSTIENQWIKSSIAYCD